MSAPDCVIAVSELRKTFQIGFARRRKLEALQGIDFDVARGEIFGFLGPNGAGKSTTIKLLAGLLFPSAGEVRVLGGAPADIEVRKRYGYLPETPSFPDYLTGREILGFLGSLVGLDRASARRRAGEMLERTGLSRAGDLQIRRYSKGMVQRLGIAQSLLHQPELVILDEPMSGLDPIGRREVKDIILELRKAGRTVFFSTHIIADVEEICDRVAILLRGKVARTGAVGELIGAGPRQYEIHASGVPPGFTGGVAHQRLPDHEVFLVNDEPGARALVERLWAAGSRIQSLNVRRYSLEDLFLSEVGKGPVGGQVTFD